MKQTENEMNVSVPLEVIKASEIEPKEVKWLWYPYIPFGKVTLLQGDPGDGKSKLMLSIAALLSKGWCCTIKVDIENSKGQYIEKDKQEATKDGSESTKIQHGI